MNISAFLGTLPIMMYGMGGIFIVIVVIYFFVWLLCKVFPAKQ